MQHHERLDHIAAETLPMLRDWGQLVNLLPGVELAYDPDKQTGLSVGRQSDVCIVDELEDGFFAHPMIWKCMAPRKGLTYDEAQQMEASLRDYGRVLYTHGWRVPTLFAIDIGEYEHGYGVTCAEQMIPGGDGEWLLKDPKAAESRKWSMIEDVMLTLYDPNNHGGLPRLELSGQVVSALPYGLDLKPANLVVSAPGDWLYVVDIFGPKMIDADGNWTAYLSKLDSLAPENLRAVTASREGMVLRFWRLCEGFWDGSEHTTDERRAVLLDMLPAIGAPRYEVAMIAEEMDRGYPWLDAIYAERQV